MADFQVAYNWMMDNEDAGRKYATVPDVGGFAISGINSGAYPTSFAAIDAIQPNSARADAVQDFYFREFWNTWYAQLASDEVAKRVFDAAVNMGPGTAVKLLQTAVNSLSVVFGSSIAVDGAWGPQTVKEANDCTVGSLVSMFKSTRLAHYQAIVAATPADAKYLGTEAQPGPWWIRSMK